MLLASAPADAEVYAQFIASRKQDELSADEIETLPAAEKEKIGWSVFHRDEQGIFLLEYHILGFLKEAATAVEPRAKKISEGKPTEEKITAVKSKIDRFVFVSPRRLYLLRDGKILTNEDDVHERPIRAMTAKGPRTSVKRSDCVNPGTGLSFRIAVLDPFERSFSEEVFRDLFSYGALKGLGERRNDGFGRFSFELEASPYGEVRYSQSQAAELIGVNA